MFGVFPIQTFEVGKHSRRFFEADTVFLKILARLPRVPREHIIVYTLIPRCCQTQMARRGGTGLPAAGFSLCAAVEPNWPLRAAL